MNGIRVEGVEDLSDALKRFVKKYPDRAGDELRKEAYRFRGRLIHEMRGAVNTNTSNRMSLGNISNYYVSEPKGYGEGQSVELGAKSPHYHLIERGHELTGHGGKGRGKHLGYVQGYLVMDATTKKEDVELEKVISGMAEDMLREEGLI